MFSFLLWSFRIVKFIFLLKNILVIIKNLKIMCAVIKQGILGGLSGTIGSVVGSSWKGISTLKAKPLSVANPRTTGQVNQRNKFGNSVAFSQAILSTVIKPLWDRFAVRESGYNAFISQNIDLFAAEMPSPVANLVISKGKMSATPMSVAAYDIAEEVLTVTWDPTLKGSFEQNSDVPYIVAFDAVGKKVIGFDGTGAATRNSGTIDVTIDNTAFPTLSHAYLAFKRADGTIVSDTAYRAVDAD
jgi:hypothetical protein